MRYHPVVLAVTEAMVARMGTTEGTNAEFSVRMEVRPHSRIVM
jgi:hypothetical protein